MGFFNKTEEEIRLENERKDLKTLKTALVKNATIDSVSSIRINEYIDKVLEGGKHDFFENDFLCRVLLSFVDMDFNEAYTASQLFDNIVICIHEIFPKGIETSNYNELKELFINNFLGENGYINKGIYDYNLFNIMNNIDNSIRVMNAIKSNDLAIENIDRIKKYIIQLTKYALNEDTLVRSIISTIGKLDVSVLDVNKFLESELEEDKKRDGIYAISHDDIMMTYSALDVINSNIEKVDNMLSSLDEKAKEVRNETSKGISELNTNRELAIKDLRVCKNNLVNEMKSILEGYLVNVKDEINNKADAVFEELLSKYQEQLNEIRKMGQNIAQANTRELTLLKSETDKSLNQLREYVSNNSELHMYLEKLEKSGEIKDKLISLLEKQQVDLVPNNNNTSRGTVVEGIESLVIPDSVKISVPTTIMIPDDIKINPYYVFKNDSDFKKNMDRLREQMDRRIDKGEIFHEKMEEILECLLVGDWPYIYGPSGAGKGFLVKQIGSLLNQKVVSTGKINEKHTLAGYIDAQGRFRAPAAFEACVGGHILFFDEFDNSNSDTRVNINEMYNTLRDQINDPSTKQYLRFADEIDVPINPNMRMLAAANTDGSGPTPQYNERSKTDESVQERYKPIYFAYDNRVEEKILEDYEEWYDFFAKFRSACLSYARSQGEQEAAGNVSTRDASDIRRDVYLNAKTIDQMITQYFVQIKDDEYRNAIAREIIGNYKAVGYNVDVDDNYYDFEGPLAEATRADIAKQFVKRCKTGIKR